MTIPTEPVDTLNEQLVQLLDGDFEACSEEGAEAPEWSSMPPGGAGECRLGPNAWSIDGGAWLLTPQGAHVSQQVAAAIVPGVTYFVQALASLGSEGGPAGLATLSLSNVSGSSQQRLATSAAGLPPQRGNWTLLRASFTATKGGPLFVGLEAVSQAVGWDKVKVWASYSMLGSRNNGQLEQSSSSSNSLPAGWVQTDILTPGDYPGVGMALSGAAPGGVAVRTLDGGCWLLGGQSSVFSALVTPSARPGVTYKVRALGIRASSSYANARVFLSASPNGPAFDDDPLALASQALVLASTSEWSEFAVEVFATSASPIYVNLESSRDIATAVAGWDSVTVRVHKPWVENGDFAEVTRMTAAAATNSSSSIGPFGGPAGWTMTDIGAAGDHVSALLVYPSFAAPAGLTLVAPDGGSFLMGGRSSVFSQLVVDDAVAGETYAFRVWAAQASSSYATVNVTLSSKANGPALKNAPAAAVTGLRLAVPGRWVAVQVSVQAASSGPIYLNLASTRDVTTALAAWSGAEPVWLANGGFEASGSGTPASWNFEDILNAGDFGPIGVTNNGSRPAGVTVSAYSGSRWLNGGRSSLFWQRALVDTVAGSVYTVRCKGVRAGTSYGVGQLLLSSDAGGNGDTLASDEQTLTTTGVWVPFEASFTASASGPLYISLVSKRNANIGVVGWDDVELLINGQ